MLLSKYIKLLQEQLAENGDMHVVHAQDDMGDVVLMSPNAFDVERAVAEDMPEGAQADDGDDILVVTY